MTKNCPECNGKMVTAIYPRNVKSVWSGQEVYLCPVCNYSEDKHGNKIPTWKQSSNKELQLSKFIRDCIKENHCPVGLYECCDECSIRHKCNSVCTDSNCKIRKERSKEISLSFSGT